MKIIAFVLLAAFFTSCNSTQKVAETSSASQTRTLKTLIPPPPAAIPPAYNMKFIQNYFDETYQGLVNATKGLSTEQLNFKASPEKWSIMECLEHIVMTEPLLFEYEKEALSKPATPEKPELIKFTDDDILRMMMDRSHKAKASEEMTPAGKYKDVQSALQDLQNQRKEIIAYLENYTQDDLRNRVMESPFGSIDAYQFMLFIPGHASRHTLQILEVKLDPNFPKN